MTEAIRILTAARDALFALSDETLGDNHSLALEIETQGVLLEEQILAVLGAVAAA